MMKEIPAKRFVIVKILPTPDQAVHFQQVGSTARLSFQQSPRRKSPGVLPNWSLSIIPAIYRHQMKLFGVLILPEGEILWLDGMANILAHNLTELYIDDFQPPGGVRPPGGCFRLHPATLLTLNGTIFFNQGSGKFASSLSRISSQSCPLPLVGGVYVWNPHLSVE